MESKTLCIVGCCKNVEQFLPSVLGNFDTIASWWKECKIVIYENDSTDRTSAILHEWKAKGGHREIIQETNLSQRYPSRTERLAYIRNRLLYHVPPFFDYMFMVDMDDVFTQPVQKKSFESCFELNSWNVMTANTDAYYDIWALRVPGLIEYDCWEKYFELIAKGMPKSLAEAESIGRIGEFMHRRKDIMNVHSAFNAGALYKISSIHPCCKFVGKTTAGKEICEHVPFQTCLRSHGNRILFNPNFKL